MKPEQYRLQTSALEAIDGQVSRIEVSFPDAPSSLTTTEVTAALETITYLYDLALNEKHPGLLVGGVSDFGSPRRRLRTRPEAALRVQRIQYGSPWIIDLLIPVAVSVPFFKALLEFAGAIVNTSLKERGETGREEARQAGETERERIRQAGETEREQIRQGVPPHPEGPTEAETPAALLPKPPAPPRSGSGVSGEVAWATESAIDRARKPQILLSDIMNTQMPPNSRGNL